MEKTIILLHKNFNKEIIDSIIKNGNMKTIGLHFNPYESNYKDFFSFIEQNRTIINEIQNNSINVEYYLHVVSYLVPRELIDTHKEFFRMNESGLRVNDFNICASSKEALKMIEKNSFTLAQFLKQKSNIYHLYVDDNLGKSVICNCDKCKKYNEFEQQKIIYDSILKGLKKYDENAKISFLVYGNSDLNIELSDDYFIEYAPFIKNHYLPIKHENNEKSRIEFLNLRKRYRDIRVLEYFLSYDFKRYLEDDLKVKEDLLFYKDNGIEYLSTFVVVKDCGTSDIIKGIKHFLDMG